MPEEGSAIVGEMRLGGCRRRRRCSDLDLVEF